MTTAYDVRASLTLQARNAGEIRRLSSEVRQLGEQIRGSSNAARGMLNQLLAMGGAYAGISAIKGAFRGLVTSAVGYVSELEKTKIGLQSVVSAVEEVPWEEAGRRGEAAFKKVREMAILSPATSKEMFDIFQGIIGPIESAGFSMQKVLDITNDTVLAASALNVDYAQATRDISMMARGTAGMEVKLFSMLRSTGAIKEDAKEWNALLPAQRVEKLSTALKKFAGSGKAFGSSWAGVTSTFADIVDNFKASAFSPIMKVMGRNLERFNGYILEHRAELEAFFERVGTDVAMRLDTWIGKARTGFTYVITHWDEIVAKFDAVVSKVKEVAPIIAKAAIAWQGVQLGREVVGGGIAAAGTMGQLVSGVGGGLAGAFAGKQAAAGAVAASGATRALQLEGFTEAMLMGGAMTGGAGAGGAGAAGAGATAAGGALVALGPILLAFAVVVAAVGAMFLAAKDNWAAFQAIFAESTGGLVEELVRLGKAVWSFLAPVLKVVGHILLTILAPAFTLLVTAIRGVVWFLTVLFDIFGQITTVIYEKLKPALTFLQDFFAKLASWINNTFGKYWDKVDESRTEQERKAVERAWGPNGTQRGGSTDPNTNWDRWNPALTGPLKTKDQVDLSKVAKAGVNVTNDFRGSRIQVKQEFKGDQDPDRIVLAMVHDLTRQAEQRISSGFAGALSR